MRLIATVLIALAVVKPIQERRHPVPPPEAQKESERLVREVFKEEFARRSAADRAALAEKLVQQGLETKDDPAAQFVLFREARELAAQAGNVALAMKAIDETSRRFEVDGPALKSAVLTTVTQNVKTPEEAKSLAQVYLSLADEAVKQDQLDAAEKAANGAAALARKAKDVSLVGRIDARLKEILDFKSRQDNLKSARALLAKDPNDPSANLAIGKYLCWNKGDWDVGLQHLAKGADASLQALALRDLKNPEDPTERTALGDAWWELAEKEKGTERTNLRMRAVYWYGLAYPKLGGLTKVKVEKRLAESGPPGLAQLEIDLLSLIDPKQDSVEGSWQRPDRELISPLGQWARIQVPYVPPDEYDLSLIVERKEGLYSFEIGLASGGRQFHIGFDGWKNGDITGLNLVDGKDGSSNETTYRGKLILKDQPIPILCRVRKTGVAVLVDDKPIFHWKGELRRLTASSWWAVPRKDALFVGSWESRFHISKLSLVPVSGEGRKLR